MSNRTIRLYCCGGTGINIGSHFETLKVEPSLFATVDCCYIDASLSNTLAVDIPSEKLYVFKGMDGSGAIRNTNASVIVENITSILQKYKPGDLNIVLHSASGGSGSVIGPSIVSQLKAMGQEVISVVVFGMESIIHTENTVKTIETYDSISRLRESSTVLFPVFNDKGDRKNANSRAIYAISYLAFLYSGAHSELDSSDLKTWLSRPSIVSSKNTLTTLDILSDKNVISGLEKVVSVATLAVSGTDASLDIPVKFQAIGFVPSVCTTKSFENLWSKDKDPIHYVIAFDGLKDFYQAAVNKVKDETDKVSAQFDTTTTYVSKDSATNNGLIL